jgi:hypothetical protein
VPVHSTRRADHPDRSATARNPFRFLSKLAHQTFNGYVISQFKKLEADIRANGAPRWKHAMHLIRLLLAGITLLREGFVLIDVGEHREPLLRIGRGELSWEELNTWRLDLHT